MSSSSRVPAAGAGRCASAVGRQHPTGHRVVEPGVAGGHDSRRADELLARCVLQHEPGGAGTQRARQHLVVVERREDEDGRCIGPGSQPTRRLDAVHALHADVHDHDVGRDVLGPRRARLRRRRTRRRSRSPRRDGGCAAARPAPAPGRRRAGRRITRARPPSGTSTSTSHSPSRAPACNVPPSSSARCCMPRTPSPSPFPLARSPTERVADPQRRSRAKPISMRTAARGAGRVLDDVRQRFLRDAVERQPGRRRQRRRRRRPA